MSSSAATYQGGKYLEVFCAQGVDPLSKLRISGGQTVCKEFDPVIKGFVIALSGSPATTRIQLPKAERKHLKLSHFVILLQILIPDGSRTIFEINVTDTGNNKRRLQVSTLYGRVSTTPLQAKIPLNCVPNDQWVWFALDVASLLSCVYPDHHLQYIDGISCCGTCKVRRIAMLRDQSCLLLGELPTSWFPPPSAPSLPLITFDDSLVEQCSVTHTSMRKGGVSGNRIDQRHSKPMHVAFGEKIAVPSHVLKSQPHSDKRPKPVPSKSKSTSIPSEPHLHSIDQSQVILGKPTRPLPPPVDHTPSTTDDSDQYLISSSSRSFPSSTSNVIGTTTSSATITNSSPAGFNGGYYYNRDEGVDEVRMSDGEPSTSVSPVRSSSVGFPNEDTGNAHFNFRSVPHSVVGERVVVQHSSKHTAVNNDHHTNGIMVESTDSTGTGGATGINSNRGARPDDDFISNNDTTEEYDWRKYQEDEDDQTSESSFNDDDNEEAGHSSDNAHQLQQTIPLAGNDELLTQSTGFDTLKKKLEELQDFNNDTLDVNEMGGAHSPTATATMATTTDDKVELVYDKDLNCFYDPLTGKYYKLTE